MTSTPDPTDENQDVTAGYMKLIEQCRKALERALVSRPLIRLPAALRMITSINELNTDFMVSPDRCLPIIAGMLDGKSIPDYPTNLPPNATISALIDAAQNQRNLEALAQALEAVLELCEHYVTGLAADDVELIPSASDLVHRVQDALSPAPA